MNKPNYPYIALGLGLFLLLVIITGGKTGSSGSTVLPLLALLIISEFAFFITIIGTYIAFKQIPNAGIYSIHTLMAACCLLLAICFLILGINFWPL